MSSIATRVNAERNNRWLLIGAAVLAVVAGALIFVALANFSDGSDDGGSAASSGDAKVLVATQDIAAGEKLDEDMFRVATFAEDDLIGGHIEDVTLVEGQVARVPIVEGSQISGTFIGAQPTEDEFVDQLTFKVPDGMRAYSMSVVEDTAVGGLLVPSDRVDLIVEYITKPSRDSDIEFRHIELLAENIEVLAVAQESVEQSIATAPVVEGDEPVAGDDVDPGIARRPEDDDTNEGARTVTLALTPEQVMRVTRFLDEEDATIRSALRQFGDDAAFGQEPIVYEIFRR
jgi:Flp pilus assembly protein CpaB